MKDYGQKYPVYKVNTELTTHEKVLIAIIIATCIISFAGAFWLPV